MIKHKLSLILLSALALVIVFSSCANGVDSDDSNNSVEVKEVDGCLKVYHSEFAFDADIYQREVLELISRDAGSGEKKEEAEKGLANVLIDFVWDKAVTIATGQGNKIIKMVKDTLLKKVTEYGKKYLIQVLGAKDNALLRLVFGIEKEKDKKDVYTQIKLLAESQDVMNKKLAQISATLEAATLGNIINDKIKTYNAIQVVNNSTMEEVQAVYYAYADAPEGEETDTVVNNALKKILSKWGSQVVNGETNYKNCEVLFANYLQKWDTGIDSGNESQKTFIEIYDALARRIYGWESEGYQLRQMYRTVDAAVLSQSMLLTSLYYRLVEGNNEAVKNLQTKYDEVVAYMEGQSIKFDYDHVICQIPGVAKKFKSSLWVKTGRDYALAVTSYGWIPGWFNAVPAHYNMHNKNVGKRLQFAEKHVDSNEEYKAPELLSMDDYKTIVDYYENKYTLREIFINYAGFLNADEALQSAEGVGSYLLNSNSAPDKWWESDGILSRDWVYWAVTNMNEKNLPKHNPEWNSEFHSERDLRFVDNFLIQNRVWGGYYEKDIGRPASGYRIFYPVVD